MSLDSLYQEIVRVKSLRKDPFPPILVLCQSRIAGLHCSRFIPLQIEGSSLANVRFVTENDLLATLLADESHSWIELDSVARLIAVSKAVDLGPLELRKFSHHIPTLKSFSNFFKKIEKLPEKEFQLLCTTDDSKSELFVKYLEETYSQGIWHEGVTSAVNRIALSDYITYLPDIVVQSGCSISPVLLPIKEQLTLLDHWHEVGDQSSRSSPELEWMISSSPQSEIENAMANLVCDGEDKSPLYRVAIAHPPDAQYHKWIETLADEMNIPANGKSSKTLGQTANGKRLLCFFRLIDSDFQSEILDELLSVLPDSLSHWSESGQLVLRELGRFQGYDDLTKTSQMRKSFIEGTAQPKFDFKGRCKAEDFHNFLEFLSILEALRTGLLEIKTWQEGVAWIKTFLGAICDDQSDFHLEFTSLTSFKGSPTFALFKIAIQAILDQAQRPNHHYGHGFYFGTINDLAGLEFDKVIIVGLVEGKTPYPPTSDPLVTGSFFEVLSKYEDVSIQAQKDAFESLLRNSCRVLLSTSTIEINGYDYSIPSRWFFEIASEQFHQPIRNIEEALSMNDPKVMDFTRSRDYNLQEDSNGNRETITRSATNLIKKRKDSRLSEFDGLVRVNLNERSIGVRNLETLSKCPRKFFYQTVLNIKANEKLQPFWTAPSIRSGSALHECMKSPSEQEFDYLLSTLELEGHAIPGFRFNRQKQQLKIQFTNLLPIYQEITSNSLDIQNEVSIHHSFNFNQKLLSVSGRIDQIVSFQSGSCLLDFKSGGDFTNAIEKIDKWDGSILQVPIYMLVMKSQMGLSPQGYYLFLKTAKPKLVTADYLNFCEGTVLPLLTQILDSGTFFVFPLPTKALGLSECTYCEYKSTCCVSPIKEWNRKILSDDATLRSFAQMKKVDSPSPEGELND